MSASHNPGWVNVTRPSWIDQVDGSASRGGSGSRRRTRRARRTRFSSERVSSASASDKGAAASSWNGSVKLAGNDENEAGAAEDDNDRVAIAESRS